ncbi:hypothetical protein JL721_9162 [Aureococcus anophagefferens]|nr:hypothetical protein JL721_9162 [Aureococcus anophagefferens]
MDDEEKALVARGKRKLLKVKLANLSALMLKCHAIMGTVAAICRKMRDDPYRPPPPRKEGRAFARDTAETRTPATAGLFSKEATRLAREKRDAARRVRRKRSRPEDAARGRAPRRTPGSSRRTVRPPTTPPRRRRRSTARRRRRHGRRRRRGADDDDLADLE